MSLLPAIRCNSFYYHPSAHPRWPSLAWWVDVQVPKRKVQRNIHLCGEFFFFFSSYIFYILCKFNIYHYMTFRLQLLVEIFCAAAGYKGRDKSYNLWCWLSWEPVLTEICDGRWRLSCDGKFVTLDAHIMSCFFLFWGGFSAFVPQILHVQQHNYLPRR